MQMDNLFLIISHKEFNLDKYFFCFLRQDFRKLDLSVQNYGGIRMTGFQLVDSENERNRPFFDAWGRLDPVDWPGAGGEAITVGVAGLLANERRFTL